MVAEFANVIAWVESRLDSMEARAPMWGPPLAVELQYLLLLETHLALTIEDPEERDREIAKHRRRWPALIGQMGFAPAKPLADQLPGDEEEVYNALVECLGRFRMEHVS